MTYTTMKKKGEKREMDTWIDKVMVIWTRFMWDIEKQPL